MFFNVCRDQGKFLCNLQNSNISYTKTNEITNTSDDALCKECVGCCGGAAQHNNDRPAVQNEASFEDDVAGPPVG